MNKIYVVLFFIMLICVGCEWQLKSADTDSEDAQVSIERYDRIESLFLTTGDLSAIQQMNTVYPMQTRMLIENVLRIGKVDDEQINARLLHFFQDSTLQQMLADVKKQYENIDDLNEEISLAFERLKEDIPTLEVPQIYTQIGSFDQSIIVGNNTLGISLDKYLGSDYPFYIEHYNDAQRSMMTRDMIVPDCLSFYLLSLYPLTSQDTITLQQRVEHMGRIQWVVNTVTKRRVFSNEHVNKVDRFMRRNTKMSVDRLLRTTD